MLIKLMGTSDTLPLQTKKLDGKPSPRGADHCLPAAEVEQFRQRARSKDTSDEVAGELSAALGLAQQIRSEDLYIDSATERMQSVFECLLADKPKLILARDERLRLQMDVYRQAGGFTKYLARISSGSTAALVLAALTASLLIWTMIVIIFTVLVKGILFRFFGHNFTIDSPVLQDGVFFMDGRALLVIVFAAFLGGVVSIATRMREFSLIRDLDPFLVFWTAMLKPLIGVVLSVFLLATLAGEVVSFGFLGNDPFGLAKANDGTEAKANSGTAAKANNGTEAKANNGTQSVPVKTLYVLWVLGFLAGFSERFAWDFIDRAQGVAAGGLAKDKAT